MLESLFQQSGDLLKIFSDSQDLILGTLASLLAVCRIWSTVYDYRRSPSPVGCDVACRIMWYLMIGSMSWLPTCLARVRHEPHWSWYNDRIPFFEMGTGYINAVLITLLARSCFAVQRPQRTIYRILRTVIVGIAATAIMVALLEELMMIPGLITIAVLSIEISIPHIFSGFRMEAQGANIHVTSGLLLRSALVGFAVFAIHCGCCLLWFRQRSRLRLAFVLLTLIPAACVAWHADASVATGLSNSLTEFHVTKDFRRILTMAVSALPLASMTAWAVSHRDLDRVKTVRLDTDNTGVVQRCELMVLALLAVTYLLNFYYVLYFFVTSGWGLSFDYISRGLFFLHTLPFFACTFACGRWVRMHWSRHISAPTTYFENMSLSATAAATAIIIVQLMIVSVLTCWLTFTCLYLPLP